MSVFSSIGRMVQAYTEMRRLSRDEQFLNSLPHEIRKDIGWPDARDRLAARYPHLNNH
ncbi:hypothetical protein FQ775_23905 [Nitratireductor mangrovi]|uniref:DUF1127 domain-containing protein n=1 Tax=Nitratireductor mangrovi TaxID=2599600 RepID=A0A6H0DX49_9HYPH|nr:hypothetical protein [Nitratireductor mangrovi]QIS94650.1 hypothetical protein FQ775_23905 [Nitratireductor mangrovi]